MTKIIQRFKYDQGIHFYYLRVFIRDNKEFFRGATYFNEEGGVKNDCKRRVFSKVKKIFFFEFI